MHGVSGNFYDSSLLRLLAVKLIQSGRHVLSVNTRGHDPVAHISTNGGTTRVGAAYETIDESKLDLAAWVQWGRKLGYQKIGLLGHSLGGVKVALAASSMADLPIESLVCLSPPRLNEDILAADENYGDVYRVQRSEAEDQLQRGRPETLMNVRFPQPMVISAATFMDKYASKQYDYFPMSEKIAARSLWIFGEQEVRGKRSNFRGCDEQLTRLLAASCRHRVITIPRADHNYTQNREGLWESLRNWMDDPPPLI